MSKSIRWLLTAAVSVWAGVSGWCAETPGTILPGAAAVVNWLDAAGWQARLDGTQFQLAKDMFSIRQPGMAMKTFPSIPLDGGDELLKKYQGISFRVRGDGSDEWGCIAITDGTSLGGRYYFPVKAADWVEYRIAFSDMAPPDDHGDVPSGGIEIGRLGYLTFGDRWRTGVNNRKRRHFSYQVADLRLLEQVPAADASAQYRPLPLAEAVAKMKRKDKVVIGCFGDSITAGNGLRNPDQERFATLLEADLQAHFANPAITVRSVAVGGAHTYDSIGWLDRDLSICGLPDVAIMLIGYNNRYGSQSETMYRRQLKTWMERLTAKTRGRCAIILIPTVPGVPRFFTQKPMAQITRELATEYGCAVAPVDTAIEALGPAKYKAEYLADSVHPNAAGHRMFARILKEVIIGK